MSAPQSLADLGWLLVGTLFTGGVGLFMFGVKRLYKDVDEVKAEVRALWRVNDQRVAERRGSGEFPSEVDRRRTERRK